MEMTTNEIIPDKVEQVGFQNHETMNTARGTDRNDDRIELSPVNIAKSNLRDHSCVPKSEIYEAVGIMEEGNGLIESDDGLEESFVNDHNFIQDRHDEEASLDPKRMSIDQAKVESYMGKAKRAINIVDEIRAKADKKATNIVNEIRAKTDNDVSFEDTPGKDLYVDEGSKVEEYDVVQNRNEFHSNPNRNEGDNKHTDDRVMNNTIGIEKQLMSPKPPQSICVAVYEEIKMKKL